MRVILIGEAMLEAQVASFDAIGMRKRDEFTRELEKKYGGLLPDKAVVPGNR